MILTDQFEPFPNVISVTWSKIEHENELTPRDKMSIAQTEECCYLIGGFGPVEDVEDDEEDSNEEIKEKADQQVFQI